MVKKEEIYLLCELKKWFKSIQKDRYKQLGIYKIDRWLVDIGLVIGLFYLLFVAYSYNFDLDYYNCPKGSNGEVQGSRLMLLNYESDINTPPGMCKNPFYKPSTWKNEEYLSSGEYGKKLGNDFNNAGYTVTIIMLIIGVINHFIYNRRKFKGFEI